MLRSLSGRLLIVTIVFVMLAEVLIFVPSLARHRVDYLQARLDAANIVVIAKDESGMIRAGSTRERQLLDSADVLSIAMKSEGARYPILRGETRQPVSETFELENASVLDRILDAVHSLAFADPDTVIRVQGASDPARNPMGERLEITLWHGALQADMREFALRILGLSLVISLVTATLVYLTLNRWLVRPIRSLIANMTAFRANPEAAAILEPGAGRTEIDEARRELSAMQTELRSSLIQKTRLASLGEAVAKINHDLRNMLAVAQIVADRLERSDDPLVQRTAPKLLRSLDRATALCQRTLTFGKAEEPAPVRRRVMLSTLVEEVAEAIALPETGGRIAIEAQIDPALYVEADPDQLFRVLQNLVRNAHEAIEASGRPGRIAIGAARTEDGAQIDVRDDGPGLPVTARENLFKAFRGGARKGGTGLGLYIARELVLAHGGSLDLVDSSTEGTHFRVYIPDRAGSELAA